MIVVAHRLVVYVRVVSKKVDDDVYAGERTR